MQPGKKKFRSDWEERQYVWQIEFKKEMPYREGANLGVARRLSKSGCCQEVSARKKVQQIKIEKGNAIWVNGQS